MTGYNEEWVVYYQYLEGLRQSGITNMFGASPYLAGTFNLHDAQATKILVSWMENYDELVAAQICVRD